MNDILIKEILLCPKCKSPLPCKCGYELKVKESIIQLTDLPNINTAESEEDKYIGYEHIGENFSGYDGKVIISEVNKKVSKIIKETIKDGILLDLGCGDGLFTIPLIMENVRVIAGDISNRMLRLIQEKAKLLNLDSTLVTLIRMNAYDIPLADNSVDAIIANSMLHLNSNPTKIIREIYRVLKPNGKYICLDDRPHVDDSDNTFDNHEYNDRLEFHHRYFTYLNEMNIHPVRYSWKFDRDEYCNQLFKSSIERSLDITKKIERQTFYDGFYKRMKAKGFSDQSIVPDDIHKVIFDKVDKEMIDKYGENYNDAVYIYYSNQKFIKIYEK